MPPNSRPNFLIVMSDQQRGDTLSPQFAELMPRWTEFSSRACWFREAYCPTAHCCPSRASFFTGLHPSHHGVWNNVANSQRLSTGLSPGVRLWSEDLRDAGYRCYFAGKWHVSSTENPRDRGWIEGRVSAAAGVQMGREWSDYRGWPAGGARAREFGELPQPGYAPTGHRRLFGQAGESETCAHDEAVVQDAIGFLDRASAGHDPWCIYAGLLGPHDPYEVPAEWLARVPDELAALPANYADDLSARPDYYGRLRRQVFDAMDPAEAWAARKHYLAFCAFVDHQFGRIWDTLVETGQDNNTVVILCSDHGDYAGEHGLFCKGLPAFRGAYHVPLAMAGPGIDRARSSAALVGLTDVGPTLLELAGVSPQQTASGRSLVPLLQGGAPHDWRTAWCTQMEGTEVRFSQRSIRTRDWLYVYNPAAVDELYDLRHDPGETVNLASRPEHRATMEQLCAAMWQELSRHEDGLVNDYYTVALAPVGPGLAQGQKFNPESVSAGSRSYE
jgi:arylsulfatase A-like enzyme